MSPDEIIRAWKNEDYRNNLSEEQRSQLPNHPASWVELTDAELQVATGGIIPPTNPKPRTPLCPGRSSDCTSVGCPSSYTEPSCGFFC